MIVLEYSVVMHRRVVYLQLNRLMNESLQIYLSESCILPDYWASNESLRC